MKKFVMITRDEKERVLRWFKELPNPTKEDREFYHSLIESRHIQKK